jgi:hypothetical protein
LEGAVFPEADLEEEAAEAGRHWIFGVVSKIKGYNSLYFVLSYWFVSRNHFINELDFRNYFGSMYFDFDYSLETERS